MGQAHQCFLVCIRTYKTEPPPLLFEISDLGEGSGRVGVGLGRSDPDPQTAVSKGETLRYPKNVSKNGSDRGESPPQAEIFGGFGDQHWLQVGGEPSRENIVTEKRKTILHTLLERPRDPDNFFL